MKKYAMRFVSNATYENRICNHKEVVYTLKLGGNGHLQENIHLARTSVVEESKLVYFNLEARWSSYSKIW